MKPQIPLEKIVQSNLLLYRKLIKKSFYNKEIYREMFCISQKDLSKPNSTINTSNVGILPWIKEKDSYTIKNKNLSEEYLEMRKLIKEENDLLESYNINVNRDNKKKVERTAAYVGLRVSGDNSNSNK